MHLSFMHSHDAGPQTIANPESGSLFAGEILLDSPIWNALRTEHQGIAVVEGKARRYPPAVGPLAGTPAMSRTMSRAATGCPAGLDLKRFLISESSFWIAVCPALTASISCLSALISSSGVVAGVCAKAGERQSNRRGIIPIKLFLFIRVRSPFLNCRRNELKFAGEFVWLMEVSCSLSS